MSVHKEALEDAIKVFKGRKDTGAVGVIEGCLERARRGAKDYQAGIIKS